MKNTPLYIVIFLDNSRFVGGVSYFESKWLSIPLKPIKRIFYLLPSMDYLCLEGEKYFRMSEGLKDITGKEKGIVKLQYDYIMVKRNNKVISYRITLTSKDNERYKSGDVTIREFNENDKFIKGLNPNNWR